MTLTEKAVNKIKELREGNKVLRVSVIGGGCSGLSYKLSWDDAPSEKDKISVVDGVTLVADPKSYLFIKDIELDFTDGLTGTGFTFTNPLAKQKCGCGQSFST